MPRTLHPDRGLRPRSRQARQGARQDGDEASRGPGQGRESHQQDPDQAGQAAAPPGGRPSPQAQERPTPL